MQHGVTTLAYGGGASESGFALYSPPHSGFAFSSPPHSGFALYSPPHSGFAFSSPQLLIAPSPSGLPGFDVLSILARVASRPNPTVHLGPVDATCSFVVVDIRRHDAPIVYCSPAFCRLTGYSEHEVIGRNCRFLQAPPSNDPARRGDPRKFMRQTSADVLKKAFVAGKECQTSIINFRKDGSAFINLLSVIPIGGGETGSKHEANQVVYHVGFQVDLSRQPNLPAPEPPAHKPPPTVVLKPSLSPQTFVHQNPSIPRLTMSPVLEKLLQNSLFSLPITTCTTAPLPLAHTTIPSSTTTNSLLSLLLLEYSPDPILVVSLKGAFLYVAPSISRLLGYPPRDLVGQSFADIAHPQDVVLLERQLKECTHLVPSFTETKESQQVPLIDLLFRAKTRGGTYVWVEARGRLYVEPGKSRKAIVLSARARRMPFVRWGDILPLPAGVSAGNVLDASSDSDFWAQLSGLGPSAGTIVSSSPGILSVLGIQPADSIARRVPYLCILEDRQRVEQAIQQVEGGQVDRRLVMYVRMKKGEEAVHVRLVFYPTLRDHRDGEQEISVVSGKPLGIAPPVTLLHVALCPPSSANWDDYNQVEHVPVRDPDENLFAELDVRRGSSWLYELQRLTLAHKTLNEEVARLEREVKLGGGGSTEVKEQPDIVHHPKPVSTSVPTLMPALDMTMAANNVPPPSMVATYPPPPTNDVDDNPFAYSASSHQQPQQHDNYTDARERYSSGNVYEQLEVGNGIDYPSSIQENTGSAPQQTTSTENYHQQQELHVHTRPATSSYRPLSSYRPSSLYHSSTTSSTAASSPSSLYHSSTTCSTAASSPSSTSFHSPGTYVVSPSPYHQQQQHHQQQQQHMPPPPPSTSELIHALRDEAVYHQQCATSKHPQYHHPHQQQQHGHICRASAAVHGYDPHTHAGRHAQMEDMWGTMHHGVKRSWAGR